MLKHIFFPTEHKKARVIICLRTFSFLRARALGISIVSSDCLHQAKESGHWQIDDFSIWGDATLYQRSIDGKTKWLRTTDWWNKPTVSPCQSTISASKQGKKLFDKFTIVVPKLGLETERVNRNTWITEPSLENYQAVQFLDQFPYNEDAGHLTDKDVRVLKVV